MRRITWGKVILAGEHAVVYGKMALAASISLGVTATVVRSGGSEKTEIVKKAIEVAGGEGSIRARIESELPTGSGLGSSAAVAAATIRAVREYLNKPIDNDELFALTMECERIAHGNPSGIDTATIVYGGLIGFIKGQPFQRLTMQKPLRLLLVDTGKPSESTKEMVEMVAANVDKDQLINEIGDLVVKIRADLERGNDVRKLLNQNGLLLEQLGVVGIRARKLAEELRGVGAAVKITGAGGVKAGSGMMMVMAPDLTQIKKLLDNKRIHYFETVIGDT